MQHVQLKVRTIGPTLHMACTDSYIKFKEVSAQNPIFPPE